MLFSTYIKLEMYFLTIVVIIPDFKFNGEGQTLVDSLLSKAFYTHTCLKGGKRFMSREEAYEKMEPTFEYGKTYYFDRTGITIKESELKTLYSNCIPMVESCCRLQLPKGFKFSECTPGMCFDISNIKCVKSPVVQNVALPGLDGRHPKECEVVAGYEIKAIGDVRFSVSTPVSPINGACFPVKSHICCSNTEPVNKSVSYSCCPKPCPCNLPCVDWTFAYFCITRVDDGCGPYLLVKMGVALEYTGSCECDDE